MKTLTIAAFDLDDTLLAGDSDSSWRVFLAEEGLVDAELADRRSREFLDSYLKGELDIEACSRFAVAPLVGMEGAALKDLQRLFAVRHLGPMVTDAALKLLEDHRERQHELVIITSTCRFVAETAAHLLGVEHLLATELEWFEGRLTGAVQDIPCYREGKVLRLERWAKERALTLSGALFYSDSHNDLPLLEAVDHPIAVDPDATLEAEALRRGWPILRLHRQG